MRSNGRNIILCFLLWTAVVLYNIAGSYFHAMFRDREVDWQESISFHTAWYTWFLFTFPVVYFVKRLAYADVSKGKAIIYHLLFFLLINASQIIISSVYISQMLNWLTSESYGNILLKTAVSGTFYNAFIYTIIYITISSIKQNKALQAEKNKTIQLEKQLVSSRMNLLKQQLHPHFLFNTHHSIITLMKMGEKGKAIEMMEKLSDLMRFALRENKTQEITLDKELALLELYLDIQRVRFEEKMKVELNIPVDLLQAYVPSMILQPIVENAIKYAVETTSHETKILIQAHKEDDKLVLNVKDETKEKQLQKSISQGIGLSNTQERLHTLYGNDQQLKVKHYARDGHQGVNVTIKFPLRYA